MLVPQSVSIAVARRGDNQEEANVGNEAPLVVIIGTSAWQNPTSIDVFLKFPRLYILDIALFNLSEAARWIFSFNVHAASGIAQVVLFDNSAAFWTRMTGLPSVSWPISTNSIVENN